MAEYGSDSFRSTLSGGCDFVYDYCCDLCERDGIQREAVGYCTDCEDYLCAECFNTHLKPKPLRHHVLLDQHQMPKNKTKNSFRSTLSDGCDFVYDYCCDLCEQDGKQKEAVGYCSDCQDYLCTECFNHHLRPKPMRHHILLDQKQMLKQPQNRRRYTCDLCEREDKQEEAVGYCSDCQDYLCTDCFNHHLKPKPMRNHVLLDQHQMLKDQHKTPAVSQQEAAGLVPHPKTPTTRDAMRTRVQHVEDIKVKSRDDSKISCITGCVVLPGSKLVLVESNNRKVKLIDLTRNSIVSQLDLRGTDTTQVSSKQVAVTSDCEQTIYFVNVGDKLKLDHKVKVTGNCYGIASINNNLVVAYYEPVKVEIISIKGKVLQTVVTEDKGKELFTQPWHVAVSKDQKTIYISDCDSQTVTSVALTGQVLATYKGGRLGWPEGLTVDMAGTVYVCGQFYSNILQLTADLTEVQELLQESDGIAHPYSVCYCETTDRLYIGMFNKDVVKVYQLN